MIQNSVIGVDVKLFDMDVVFVVLAAPITATKPLAITTTFSYLKGVNRNGFNASNSTKTVRN